MNVTWYYAVGGERTGPVSWDAVRKAVEEKIIGPDDFVWSPAFGTEWRKASTLEGLFPPEKKETETPPEDSLDNNENAGLPESGASPESPQPPLKSIEELMEGLPPELAEKLKSRIPRSPFTPPQTAADGSPPPPEPVVCLKSLSRGWQNTVTILFSNFSLRRWFIMAICVMLTMVSMPNPVTWLTSLAASGKPTSQASEMGLDQVMTSGVFELFGKLQSMPAEERASLTDEEQKEMFSDAVRDTAVGIRDWAAGSSSSYGTPTSVDSVSMQSKTKRERTKLILIGLLLYVFVVTINIWFATRGHSMLLIRVYAPDSFAISSWIAAQRPSSQLFRGMLTIKLVSVAIFCIVFVNAVSAIASLPADSPDLYTTVMRHGFALMAILIIDRVLIGYVADFVTPHVILEGRSFISAFAETFSYIGFWLLRYLFLLCLAYLLFGTTIFLVGMLFGMSALMALLLVGSMPFLAAILMLPLHLLRRLWTLDMVFRKRPDLRLAVPKPGIIHLPR